MRAPTFLGTFARWTPWATVLLITILVVVFSQTKAAEWSLDFQGVRNAWESKTFTPALFTLITASFVHWNAAHLANNAFALLLFGSCLELLLVRKRPVLGRIVLWLLFVASGLVTALVETAFSTGGLGASAGLNGLCGAGLVVGIAAVIQALRCRDEESLLFAFLGAWLATMNLIGLIPDVMTAHRPHLTGFATGFALTLLCLLATAMVTRLKTKLSDIFDR